MSANVQFAKLSRRIGGEVGIYERVEGRGLQAEKPDFMPEMILELAA